jgi:hypothetical protein
VGKLVSQKNVPQPDKPSNADIAAAEAAAAAAAAALNSEAAASAEKTPRFNKPVEGPLEVWRRMVSRVDRVNGDLHSMRCDTNLKLKVANLFISMHCCWYPVPTLLSRHCRPCLSFSCRRNPVL